jgi:hypothetical protein
LRRTTIPQEDPEATIRSFAFRARSEKEPLAFATVYVEPGRDARGSFAATLIARLATAGDPVM